MQNRPDPGYSTLVHLFEKAQKQDPAAREQLRDRFDHWAAEMWNGRQARQELGELAYRISSKQAAKKLGRGGRFDDLANDPGSVASLHWQKFQNFSDEIDRGTNKTIDDFIARINKLTECVLLDMVAEKNKLGNQAGALFDGVAESPDPIPEEDLGRVRENYLDALRQARQSLPCRLFLVVVLHLICGKPKTDIAEILGTTAHYVGLDLDHAKRLLDQVAEPNTEWGWDLPLV